MDTYLMEPIEQHLCPQIVCTCDNSTHMRWLSARSSKQTYCNDAEVLYINLKQIAPQYTKQVNFNKPIKLRNIWGQVILKGKIILRARYFD